VLNRDLKLVFTCNLVGSFGDGLYAYLLPVYMSNTLGADSVQIGLLYAVLNLFATLTLLVSGTLADRYDRKKIMIAGWLAWLPVPLIFSFAGNWIEMLPGMIMWGFWLGGPAGTAYIVTAGDPSTLTLTFTTMSVAWSVGYIFSPALGGFLAGNIGMKPVFYMAFILYSLACLTLSFIKSQRARHAQTRTESDYSFKELLKTRKLLNLTIFFGALMFVLTMFRPFIPKFVADVYKFGDFEVGILGSVSFASSAVLGLLLGSLGDRSSKSYPLALSAILSSASMVLLLLSGSFAILAISFILIGGSYLTWSLMSAVAGPLAPEPCRARWVAVPQTVSMFVSIIAPYLGGFLYAYSPQYPFMVAVVAMPVLALLAVRLFRD
jgi:DHA1 family multidrug resistance protein-like MFS transporter